MGRMRQPKGMPLPGVFGWVLMALFARWKVSVFTPGVRVEGQVNEPTVHCGNPEWLPYLHWMASKYCELIFISIIPLTAWKTMTCSAFVNILNQLRVTLVCGLFRCNLWLRPVLNSDSLILTMQLDSQNLKLAGFNSNVCVAVKHFKQ